MGPSTPGGMGDALNFQEAAIPSYKSRARKGLSADGSTRAWRRMRDKLPRKPKCPDGSKPFVNHKKPRRLGGTDSPQNLEWGCGHNPGTGRPRKSAPRSHFSAANRARGRRA